MVAPISIEERDLANQHLDRSISFALTGKIDQAISEAKKAIEIDPDFAQAFNKLGDYYLKKGAISEAVDVYRKSIVLNPENENSHFDLGRSLAMLGKYEEALESLNKALDLDPTHGETYSHTGMVYIHLGDNERAITNLQTALSKDPENLMASYLMAIACKNSGMENEANKYFKKVLDRYQHLVQSKSRFAEGHYYIGRCYFYLNNLEEALPHLEKAVEYDTDQIDFHYSFGMLYSDADAFYALAEAYQANGSTGKAFENLNKALAIDPQNPKFNDLKNKLGVR
ncbi:MAG: tetratricopeptide repeat protein [Candidatus Riflebacteria bacterium]